MNRASLRRSPRARMVIGLVVSFAAGAMAGGAISAPSGRYAAIEVGAKGVKAVVLEMTPEGPRPLLKVVSNTTLAQGVAKSGTYAPGAIRDTAEQAGDFARRVREDFRVPAGRVTVFGSSGLPRAANRDDLARAVADATAMPAMTFITPAEEVRATIRGSLADPADRERGLVVDVGSGNTKGGFLDAAGVVDFSVPFGSVTYENKVAAEAKGSNQPFAQAADRLRPATLDAEFSRQIAAHPEIRRRAVVYLSGGAAYAMVSLMKPEAVRASRVEFTAGDIQEYARLVRATPPQFPPLDRIADPAARSEAEKEVRNVFDVFTPTNLIAGAEILESLASTLELEGKSLRFDRDSLFALSRGRILELADKEMPPAVAQPPSAAVVETPKAAVVETPKAAAPRPARPPVYPSPQSPPPH